MLPYSSIDQFAKLQSSALRKMLGIFKITEISIMEIEAAVIPIPIRLEKHCKNYAIRILQLDPSYSMRKRIKFLYQLSTITDPSTHFQKPTKFSNMNTQLVILKVFIIKNAIFEL
jgi:hypothetical protein